MAMYSCSVYIKRIIRLGKMRVF